MGEPFKLDSEARLNEITEQSGSNEKQIDSSIEKTAYSISVALEKLTSLSGYHKKIIRYDIEIIVFEKNFRNKIKVDGLNKPELFFVEFSNQGEVVVVGAGYDMGRSHSERSRNWKILKDRKLDWSEKAIIIKVYGLKPSKGHIGVDSKGCDHILQCRNGVETYIGESLINSGIEILNDSSHWNYRGLDKKRWDKIIKDVFENPAFRKFAK